MRLLDSGEAVPLLPGHFPAPVLLEGRWWHLPSLRRGERTDPHPLCGQVTPSTAGAQHEQDPFQCRAILDPWSATRPAWSWARREQRLDQLPEPVVDESLVRRHGRRGSLVRQPRSRTDTPGFETRSESRSTGRSWVTSTGREPWPVQLRHLPALCRPLAIRLQRNTSSGARPWRAHPPKKIFEVCSWVVEVGVGSPTEGVQAPNTP